MFIIWVSAHRGLIFAILCLFLWGFANIYYLRFDIRNYLHSRKARNWSVDMETKTAKGMKVKAHH